jgi:hypothetical protein
MKATVYNNEIEITNMNAEFAGYGHYKVIADILYSGRSKKFTHTTTNMDAIDEAKEAGVEYGSEAKHEILWGIIENHIEDQILEFIDEVNDEVEDENSPYIIIDKTSNTDKKYVTTDGSTVAILEDNDIMEFESEADADLYIEEAGWAWATSMKKTRA